MTASDPIVIHVTVPVPVDTAFEIFVDEIGRWWRPGPDSWNDPLRAIDIRFERGVGGRWVECYDPLGDDAFEMGEITGWVPGESIAMTYHARSLGDGGFPLDIRFEAGAGATTVTLRHDGWDGSGGSDVDRRDRAARGWEAVLRWYREWVEWGSPRRVELPARQSYILPPGEGLNGGSSAKANRAATFGKFTIIESVTEGGAPLHVHRDDDEAFYVVEGTMTITIDGHTQEVPQGGFAFVPNGAPHAWDTIGEARILFITAPSGLDEFLSRLHTWPTGYADAWRELAERHGYHLV